MNILIALFAGGVFGGLLQKAKVSRFDTIIGQLTLKDFTVMKVMFTAIAVGSLCLYAVDFFGLIPAFHLSKTPILLSACGGCLFGLGMSLAGYCPGTAVVALASGSKDMVAAILGMLCGVFVFNLLSPTLLPLLSKRDALFQETLATYLSVSPWIIVACLLCCLILLITALQKIEKRAEVSL